MVLLSHDSVEKLKVAERDFRMLLDKHQPVGHSGFLV